MTVTTWDNPPKDTLRLGCAILDAVLLRAGFVLVLGDSGRSSGGDFARAEYVKGDRKLELHFRHSLGLVRYHIGSESLGHGDYVRTTAGRGVKVSYPLFSEEPLDAFRALADDLEEFGADFLGGSGELFSRACKDARRRAGLTGLQRLEEDGG